MARPKDNNKRNNILAACQTAIVRDGLNTTTSDIAKEAGIATGSLFTYFPTKTDLLNELYVLLKTEMADALAIELSKETRSKEKLHSAWTGWTNWAATNSEKHLALELLRTSDHLTNKSRTLGNAAVKPVFDLINANVSQNINYPQNFLYELIDAVSIKTMDKMALHSENAAEYREAGFEAVWKIITKE